MVFFRIYSKWNLNIGIYNNSWCYDKSDQKVHSFITCYLTIIIITNSALNNSLSTRAITHVTLQSPLRACTRHIVNYQTTLSSKFNTQSLSHKTCQQTLITFNQCDSLCLGLLLYLRTFTTNHRGLTILPVVISIGLMPYSSADHFFWGVYN